MNSTKPVIIAHGGAKSISPDKVVANRAGCVAAVEAGWEVLDTGILLDREGRIGWAYNSQDMAVAYRSEALQEPAFFTCKEQLLATT